MKNVEFLICSILPLSQEFFLNFWMLWQPQTLFSWFLKPERLQILVFQLSIQHAVECVLSKKLFKFKRGHRGNKLSKPVIFLDVDSPAISVCSCFFFAFRFCFCFVLSSFCDSYLRDGRLNTRYSTTSGSRTFFFGFKKKEKKG